MLSSIARVLLVATILASSLGLALGVGLALAGLGYLGTCQDGSCELVAVIYVMPALGFAFYISSLALLSVAALNRRKAKESLGIST